MKASAMRIAVWALAGLLVVFVTACTMLAGKQVPAAGQPISMRGKVRLFTEAGESNYLMGCVYQNRKAYRLAVEAFQRAVHVDPGNAVAYNLMGVCHDKLQQYHQAATAYEAALAIDPEFADALNNLGYSYLLQDRPNAAITVLEHAVTLDKTVPRYYNNLALAYAVTGNYDAAMSAFSRADDLAKAHKNIAKAYYRNGHYEKAAAHLANVRQLSSDRSLNRMTARGANTLARVHGAPTVEIVADAQSGFVEGVEETAIDDQSFYTIPDGVMEDMVVAQVAPDAPQVLQPIEKPREDIPLPPVAVSHLVPTTNAITRFIDIDIAGIGSAVNENQNRVMLGPEFLENMPTGAHRASIEISNGNGVRRMARTVGNYMGGRGFIPMYLSNAAHFDYADTVVYYAKGAYKDAFRLSLHLPGLQRLEEVPLIRGGHAKISLRIGQDLSNHANLFKQQS